jgi:hypothetical protein
LPKHEQGYESREHQRCKHHLNDRETGRVFAKKPTCNNAARSVAETADLGVAVVNSTLIAAFAAFAAFNSSLMLTIRITNSASFQD